MTEGSVTVSYDTFRWWGLALGRRSRNACEEHGHWMYLWRAIDRDGEIFHVLFQSKRDKNAVLKLMRKLLKKPGLALGTIITDKCWA